jgi:hypothetical protein
MGSIDLIFVFLANNYSLLFYGRISIFLNFNPYFCRKFSKTKLHFNYVSFKYTI